MAADEDLRAYILADATVSGITTEIFVNSVPEAGGIPFVYMRRARTEYCEVIGEAAPIKSTWYDIECVSGDLDEAMTLADAVRDRLQGHSGNMGSAAYAWVDVQDHYDDYIPRVLEADEHLQVSSLSVEVTHA